VPEFRAQYSQILNDLLCGPINEADFHAFLDALEPVLSEALAADPNNQIGGESVASFFEGRKAWFSQRIAAVKSQIDGFEECTKTPCAGDLNGNANVDVDDLLAVINAWGAGVGSIADINGSGLVDVDDLLVVINTWGPCG
jgi:hypothetical protein